LRGGCGLDGVAGGIAGRQTDASAAEIASQLDALETRPALRSICLEISVIRSHHAPSVELGNCNRKIGCNRFKTGFWLQPVADSENRTNRLPRVHQKHPRIAGFFPAQKRPLSAMLLNHAESRATMLSRKLFVELRR
jgi:hypothetical protein